MKQILALNKIAECGLSQLPGDRYTISSDCANPDGIILRSFSMHEMELPESLLAVARAGAGVNNIPVDKCAEKGIVVFNTPGANANAVKELVIASLLLASRKIVDGINWTQSLAGNEGVAKLVEKGKGDFVGPEIYGKKLGVIGLGAIGVMVANAALSMGMEVMGYDPYISVDAAWKLSVGTERVSKLEQIYEACDYITIHAPLIADTKNLFNEAVFKKLKKGVRIINLARAELVDNKALVAAIEEGIVASYVTDFPTDEVLGIKNIVTIPHLGASTPESEDNCAIMAAAQLKNYLEYGNIKNSVNYPDCELPYSGKKRICITHQNIPNVISHLTAVCGNKDINIDNLINKSKGSYAYTIIDVDNPSVDGLETELMSVEGVIKVRII